MADNISGYYTKNSGPQDNGNVTVSTVPGDKIALDVKVQGGSITATTSPGDVPSEDPDTGSTDHFNGTVGLVAVAVPAVAGGTITSVLIECTKQNPSTTKLFISFDGGTNFKTMAQGSSATWSPRGGLAQLYIKGNQASTEYEIIMNRNP